MAKGDREQSAGTVLAGPSQGHLQEALSADEVGLKVGAERIAPPSHPERVQAGAAQGKASRPLSSTNHSTVSPRENGDCRAGRRRNVNMIFQDFTDIRMDAYNPLE